MPPRRPEPEQEPPDQNQGGGGMLDDERMPKSEAVRYLGIVPTNNDELMARTRLARRQVFSMSMLETQEEALNPRRRHRLLSTTWRTITARNLFALDGLWRAEMQSILETAAEERAADLAMRE
jgi:hypothetical protein